MTIVVLNTQHSALITSEEIAMMRGKHLLVSLGVILILVGLSWGQDSLNVTRLGQTGHHWAQSRRVVVSGNYAYVTTNETGLRILDISNPLAPDEVGYFLTGSQAYSVTVVGNLAYLVDLEHGLYILDISNPANPIQLANTGSGNQECCDVAIYRHYAYMSDYGVIRIIDVSDPSNPVVLGSIPTNYGLNGGLAILGQYLYAANYGRGFFIFDLTNPTHPVQISNLYPTGSGHEVAVSGNYAYYTHWFGMCCIDISNPMNPQEIGVFPTTDPAKDVTVAGNYAYLANEMNGLMVLNVSDPSHPLEVSSLDTPGLTRGVALLNNLLYVADSQGLIAVDVTSPSEPAIAGYFVNWDLRHIAVSGNYTYVSDYCDFESCIRVFDTANPAQPTEVSHYSTPSLARSILISENRLYVADQDSGLYILDISNPLQLVEIGSYPVPGHTSDVAVSGNLAYLTCNDYEQGYGYLRILNVSDPAHPVEIGNYQYEVYGTGQVEVSGNYAYLTLSDYFDSYLTVLDVSDPTHPTQVVDPINTPISGMSISGNYLYIVANYTLMIYDVSNPLAPSIVGSYNSTNYLAQDIQVVGDYAFVAWYSSGLIVVDISNPTAPTLVGSYDTPEYTYAVSVSGGNVYVADDYFLSLYRFVPAPASIILTPINPPIVIPPGGGSFRFHITLDNYSIAPTTFDAWIMARFPDLTWHGPYLGPLSLTLPAGVSITRLRNQVVPGSAPTGEYIYRGYVGDHPSVRWDSSSFNFSKPDAGQEESGTGEWVNTGEPFPAEMQAFTHPPSVFSLSSSPNPFNPSTALSYELRAASRVSLRVYDTTGRLVSTLVDGWREAGAHEVTFDGSKLASGIYLARLEAGSFTAVQKLVLMK
jgi:hypothetical protein